MKTSTLQHLAINLTASRKLVRKDTMEGREYTVVPMVMMKEGVLNGSQGPLYYPPEEIAKLPEVWNHKPVVVYHPQINGQGVSACSPDILTAQKIGVIMNTKYDAETKRLLAEAWIEEVRCKKVDNRVWKAIEDEKPMELSTGLFTENEAVENGKFGDRPYTFIARNYKPDHLAVLPDQVGACSLKDGAGFIRNELFATDQRTDNSISFDDIRQQLTTVLREKYGRKGTDTIPGCYPYPEHIFDDYVVFTGSGGSSMGVSYRLINGKVQLSGIAQELRKKTIFVDSTGKVVVGNVLPWMDSHSRKEKVATIINRGVMMPKDRDWLMSLPRPKLNALFSQVSN